MALDMFLKLSDVTGESVNALHPGEIDVLAWSWGASNSGSVQIKGGAGTGKANFQDLSLTKYIDSASEDLLRLVATGQQVAEAVLTVTRAGSTPQEYVVITCRPVMITSVSTGGSGGEDRLTENVTLNFGAFEFAYTKRNTDGLADAPQTFAWDIAKNATASF